MSESEDTDIIPSPTSIVRAPTDITSVNSSLAKPAIPSRDSLAKVTYYKLDLDTILDGLIPDPLPESGGKDNAIHHLNIIIFGKPNTGKTTLAESIAQALARRYGQRNVKALRATRDLPGLFQNIDKLFGLFRKPPRAILLFADDMTKALRKLSGTVEVKNSNGQVEKMRRIDYWLDKWYDIRGELFKRGIRSRRCSAQSSTTPCASMRSTRYGTGKNLHGPPSWQRQAQGSSVSHVPQFPRNG